jgi:hypothetical protein
MKRAQDRGAIPDDAFVVRGGRMDPEDLKEAIETTHARYGAWGFSTQAAGGLSVGELAEKVPHRQVRVATAGEIRRLGYDIYPTFKPHHCTVDLGLEEPDNDAIEGLQRVFGPSQPNPARR